MRAWLTLVLVLVALGLAALWTLGRTRVPQDPVPAPRDRQAREDRPALSSAAPPELPAVRVSAREAFSSEPSHVEGSIVLEGRVLELATGAELEQGTPAAGVTVAQAQGLMGLGYDEDEQPSGVKSGADGTFRLVLPDEGKRPLALELVVEDDERFRHASVKCRLEEGESLRAGLVLARHEHGELAGRTVDVRGQPVAGVEIVLLGWDEAGETMVPRRTALSDENGAFRFERTREVWELEARKAGYTLLEALRPAQRDDGAWEPLEVVLSAQGTLRVEVVARSGEPIPGIHVWASVAAPERFGASEGWSNSLRGTRNRVTDASGTALLGGIWAEQRLRVSLFQVAGDELVLLSEFERVDGERSVPWPEPRGTPLSVESGRERTVRVEAVGRHRIHGRVLAPDGSAFPEPWISVRTLDRPRFAPGSWEQALRGDDRGRFELELLVLRPLGAVLVTANDKGPRSFTPGAAPWKSAWAVIDLSGSNASDELTLVLGATGTIAGRVVSDSDVSALIVASPRSNVLPYGTLATGVSRQTTTRKDGTFRLPGLPAGHYDLEVTPSARYPTHWVHDVEAGSEGLTITLSGTRAARIVVEVTLSEGELGETILLTGKLRPHGAVPAAPDLPAQATHRDPGGWPWHVLHLWSGGGGRTDEVGWTSYTLAPMDANPTTLELDEGLHWIGVKAKAKDGNLTLPIGTGLVRVGAGEHRLRFELGPSASVEGRVIGGVPGLELFVGLARAGRLLELDVRRDAPQRVSELGRDGWFRFPLVPAGELELRIGARDELLAGRWLRREELHAARGATLAVQVEL